ncbi:MAG: hypothetical protein ABSE77_07575 [Acidimicrobiales bacterium]
MAHVARAVPAQISSRLSLRQRAAARLRRLLGDQRGSQITDNLGLIVVGIVAVVAIGGLISGLDTTIFKYVTTELGLG